MVQHSAPALFRRDALWAAVFMASLGVAPSVSSDTTSLTDEYKVIRV